MKKLALVIISILAAAILVAAGWWFGFQQRMLTEAYAIPTIDKHLTEASMKALILHQMDSGRLDDARRMIQLQLDGEILVVDSLIDDADARSRDLAQKVFARIAAYRTGHSASYTGSLARSSTEVDAKIADILRRAKQEQAK